MKSFLNFQKENKIYPQNDINNNNIISKNKIIEKKINFQKSLLYFIIDSILFMIYSFILPTIFLSINYILNFYVGPHQINEFCDNICYEKFYYPFGCTLG